MAGHPVCHTRLGMAWWAATLRPAFVQKQLPYAIVAAITSEILGTLEFRICRQGKLRLLEHARRGQHRGSVGAVETVISSQRQQVEIVR
jgi:hypothetical protein